MADSMYRRFYCERDGYSYVGHVEERGEPMLVLVCPRCKRIGEVYRLGRLAALAESDREALTQRFGDVLQAHVDAIAQQLQDAIDLAQQSLQPQRQTGQAKSFASYPLNPWP